MRMKMAGLLLAMAMLLAASAIPAAAQQGGPPPGGRRAGGPPPMGPQLRLSSTAFSDGGTIPDKYSCTVGMGNHTSPALQWVNAPKSTVSFVLFVHDPDAHATRGLEDITHWVLYNIPGDATGLPEGVKPDAPASVGLQGKNIMGAPAYMGPCAPAGPDHHYTFELFALDAKLDVPAGASRADVVKAMEGHVLTGTVYIGLFHRTPAPQPPAVQPPAK